MAGNETVPSMTTVPTPDGGLLYITKDNEDYKVEVGVALGIAYLNSLGQVPDANVNLTWALITGKPTEFTPAAHVHDAADITTGTIDPARLPPVSSGVDWANITGIPVFAERWPTWSEVTSKPATFTPSPHNHAATDITTGTFANARIASTNVTQHQADLSIGWTQITGEPAYTTRWPSWAEVTGKPSTFAPSAHTQSYTTITGLGSAATANYSSSATAHTLVQRDASGRSWATDFVSTSDKRLKTKVEDKMPRDLANLLRFVSFVWIGSEEEALGLIAQEVQEVAPEYVHKNGDGLLSIDKAGLTLEALLGLSAYVSSLEERLVELEDRVDGTA